MDNRLNERTMYILNEILHKYPDRVAYNDLRRILTYHELEIESGKVYSYLKKNGVSTESYVQLVMSRSVGMFSCILGVLKAGAAFIPFENTYPAERLDYVKNDCNVNVVMTDELYNHIIATESYLEGYESTELHDAAYVIYTSGSTGNPKGVIHEYGNLDQLSSLHPLRDTYEECRYGLIAPFYFAACIEFSLIYLLEAGTIFIIPRDMVRDIRALSSFIEKKKIKRIFLSPSYLRMYKEPSPYLEEILTAGEPANGIYYENGKPAVRNQLGMSECGFPLLTMILDKKYDIAPVGKPVLDVDVHIIDDDGNRIEGPGQGELCFRNEYIRGYMNLPEKTASVFKNGYFHTGDLVSRDEDGRYYVIGRADDMFKINGNRIEPVEIETKVKELTGLKNVVAKGFQTPERSFIVVYFLKEQANELGIYDGKNLTCDLGRLKQILPDYMLPAYYVGLDEFPINLNGKLAKKELKAPEVSDYQRDYIAPKNDAEDFLCRIMAKVLCMEKVGATDDFYQIGGDSLKTIEFIGDCADCGCTISSSEMYTYRTPQKIAESIAEKFNFSKAIELLNNGKEEKEACKFVDGKISYYGSCFGILKKMVYDRQYYICDDFYFKEKIDPDKLQSALNKTLEVCPYPGYIVDYPKKDWRICLCKGDGNIKVLPLSEEDSIGKSWKDRESCYVFYNKNHLRIYLSHAVTDGQGSARFNNLLLAFYFNLAKDVESLENAKDYAADILDTRYPVSPDFKPIKQKKDGFKLKEVKPFNNILENHKIVVEKDKVEAMCKKYGVSLFTLSTVMLALAVMKVHPENKKDVIIRTPINTRGFFNVPDTFQNASMPHIFIRLKQDLLDKDITYILEETTKQMHEQLSKDNVSYLTNRYYDALKKATRFNLVKVILKDLFITDLYVSDFVDYALDDKLQQCLESANSNFNLFGLMLTTDAWHDSIIFNIGQRFKSDAYVNALNELLDCYLG